MIQLDRFPAALFEIAFALPMDFDLLAITDTIRKLAEVYYLPELAFEADTFSELSARLFLLTEALASPEPPVALQSPQAIDATTRELINKLARSPSASSSPGPNSDLTSARSFQARHILRCSFTAVPRGSRQRSMNFYAPKSSRNCPAVVARPPMLSHFMLDVV
jgi:hypothetical protein